jgi:NADH-quinone oxidoreductase subunit G
MLALSLRQAVRNGPNEGAQQKKIDLWNDAALREVVQDQKGPLYIAAPTATRLDDIATSAFHLAPDDIARLGFAIANAINPASPAVKQLAQAAVPGGESSAGDSAGSILAQADEIAQTLKDAKNPLVVSGTSLGSEAVIQASANIAWVLKAAGKEAKITFTLSECNSVGLALLEDKSLEHALEALRSNPDATLIVLENDLFRRADAQFVDELFQAAKRVIVLDALENATSAKADLVLPVATFAEGDGTLVNNEGRAQRYFQVFVPEGEIRESWRWIGELMNAYKHNLAGQWQSLDDVVKALALSDPLFAPVLEIAPPEDFRIVEQKVPRQPHRYSGRTAMRANINVSEPKPPDDPDTPLAFSMEGYKGHPPAELIPRYWAPGWNSVQALNKFQEEVDGLLIGGSPGRRLIEMSADAQISYFQDIPDAFAPRPDEYLIVPLPHIFGSEELSSTSPPIHERSPEPYLALNPALAGQLGVAEGEGVQIDLDGRSLRLPARLMASLPAGMLGLPVGLPAIPARLPGWGRLRPGAEQEGGQA